MTLPLFSVSETAFYFESYSVAIKCLENTLIKVIYLLNSQKENVIRLAEVGMHLPPTKLLHFHTDG